MASPFYLIHSAAIWIFIFLVVVFVVGSQFNSKIKHISWHYLDKLHINKIKNYNLCFYNYKIAKNQKNLRFVFTRKIKN